MPDIYHHKPTAKHSARKHYGPHKHQSHEGEQGHTHNPLSSYCYYPEHVSFIGTDTEEQVVLLLRRHPFTNIRWVVVAVLMTMAPIFISFFPGVALVPVRFQVVGMLIWYLIVTAFVFEEFLSWFFNVYIITDERVFDVDFVNLVYREVTDANIDQIQDVTVTVGGVSRTLFKYGDIHIQTASETARIEFEAVPYPDRVASVLRDLRVEEEQERIEGRVR